MANYPSMLEINLLLRGLEAQSQRHPRNMAPILPALLEMIMNN